jgi:hypothetical protein
MATDPDLVISIVALVVSTIISVVGLVGSIISFKRQQATAKAQAELGVKPLLLITTQTYMDEESIRLLNCGVGAALITNTKLERLPGARVPPGKVDMLGLSIVLDSFAKLVPQASFPAGGELVLIELSVRDLQLKKGYLKAEAISLLHEWRQQKEHIYLQIEYEDINGKTMPPLKQTLVKSTTVKP